MAVIISGLSRCPLCEELLGETEPLVVTWHFMIDPFHPLYAFSDAAMHQSCFLRWDKREEFVGIFNAAVALVDSWGCERHEMQADGQILTFQPSGGAASDRQERCRQAIHDAAETGTVDDIAWLLQNDVTLVNATDETGITPLHLAVAYQDADIVDALIKWGANTHARTDRGQSVLHTACIQGRAVVLGLLLDAAADVHDRDWNGTTPLHLASASSGAAVVSMLLTAGADAQARDGQGKTPLLEAASHGQREVAGVLLDAGADINGYDAFGQTPLHKAVAGGHLLLLRLLLSRGADVAAKDAGGCTSRQAAESEGNTMAVRLIDYADKHGLR